MFGGRGLVVTAGHNKNVESLLAEKEARKKSLTKSYKKLRFNYSGTIKASRQPYSRFVLFEFDDDSSEFVIDYELEEYCKPFGMKDTFKFLNYVQNYGKALTRVG
jgi:hypothetical protein